MKRILGDKWYTFFMIILILELAVVNILYYYFIIDMIFNCVTFFMKEGGYEADKNVFTLSLFS